MTKRAFVALSHKNGACVVINVDRISLVKDWSPGSHLFLIDSPTEGICVNECALVVLEMIEKAQEATEKGAATEGIIARSPKD